jgi:hypothetical protein
MWANPLRGQVGGGLGPGNRDFFGPCDIATSRQASAIRGPTKVEISGAQLPTNCPSNGFARIKSITYGAVSIRAL